MFHHWIAVVLFILAALGGLVLSFFSIGGTFLVFAGAALYNLITWSWTINLPWLLLILGLAIAGEVAEAVITARSVQKSKMSVHGVVGMVLGAILGASIFSVIPIIGSILGLIIGAFAGAFVGELLTSTKKQAWKAAKAFLIGRGLISFTKMILVFIQVWIVLATVF